MALFKSNMKNITEKKYIKSRKSRTPLSMEAKCERKLKFETILTSQSGAQPERRSVIGG